MVTTTAAIATGLSRRTPPRVRRQRIAVVIPRNGASSTLAREDVPETWIAAALRSVREVSAEFPVNPDDVLPVSCARAGSASTTRPGSGPVCNEARGLTCPAGALWHSDRRESPALSSWRRPSRCESDDREPGSFSNARASSSSTSSAIAALSSPNVDSTKPRGRGPSRHFPRPTSEEAPASRRCGEPPTSDDERPSSTPKRSPPLPLVRPCGVVVLRWPPA